MADNDKLAHEPALKEDGSEYAPYFLDDSKRLNGWQGRLCRLCHSYYAIPVLEPEHHQNREGHGHFVEFPVELEGSSACPAKLYEAMKAAIL